MSQSPKSRVIVDFPLAERDILDLLCEADLRPPAEQIRWLVLSEWRRRGIELSEKANSAAGVEAAGAAAV